MEEIQILQQAIGEISGMNQESFELSLPYWQLKTYHRGDFFNQYKNVCKYLGFIVSGVFRIYRVNEETGEEKNMMFFTDHQFVASYKSFLNQTACDYYTEAMEDATIFYIHVEKLHELYSISPAWERFGRLFAESALNGILIQTENAMFKLPEERYLEMMQEYPKLMQTIPLYHIASYLGIKGPSLSRIRKRLGATATK